MRNEPHSNGIAERAIGVLSNRATSLLHESHLPSSFWPKAVATVIHTHNRMPTSALHESTPFSALFNKKPDVSLSEFLALLHMCIFRKTRELV